MTAPAPHRTRQQARLDERYGPTAVVTGASSGIGRSCATYLAEAGFDVGLFVPAAGYGTSEPLIGNDPAAEFDMVTVNRGAVLALTHALALPALRATRSPGIARS